MKCTGGSSKVLDDNNKTFYGEGEAPAPFYSCPPCADRRLAHKVKPEAERQRGRERDEVRMAFVVTQIVCQG